MSVNLKNWQEICKEKDERIKELEGKFDLIVDKLKKRKAQLEKAYKSGYGTALELAQCNGGIVATENDIRIIKEAGGIDE